MPLTPDDNATAINRDDGDIHFTMLHDGTSSLVPSDPFYLWGRAEW